MSIVTRTGDDGTTALMYGRRVSKVHPRVEACGALDELNSALGLARALAGDDFVRDRLLPIQKELVALMGEVATALEDFERYVSDGYPLVTATMTGQLEQWIRELESQPAPCNDWATPGGNRQGAALDLARSVCRRAERKVCPLQQTGEVRNREILVYLNRLGDLLWLLARWADRNHL